MSMLRAGVLALLAVVVATSADAQAFTQGTVYSTSTTPSTFSITPESGKWNAVGVTSLSSDWDIRMLVYEPGQQGIGVADFYISDYRGTPPFVDPNQVQRLGGSGTAYACHSSRVSTNIASSMGVSWTNLDVIRLVDLPVGSGQLGNVDFTVSGISSTNLKWFVFKPRANSNWVMRSAASCLPPL